MNRIEPGPREIKATVARAYGPRTAGSKRYDADVHLAFMKDGEAVTPDTFRDVYLDYATALQLRKELNEVLAECAPQDLAEGTGA